MSSNQVPLVIYHCPCQDGFTAAWACWKAHPDWQFYPAKYGDPPPDVTGRMVYMLDFSYKLPIMRELTSKAISITVLDHHKTAEADLAELLADRDSGVYGEFNMEKSGARLAWEYFQPKEPVPPLDSYVEDRDLWKFQFDDTKAISAYLFSKEYDFDIWNTVNYLLYDERDGALIAAGQAILDKQAKDVAELCQGKFRYVIGDHEVWCVNVPHTLASDTGHLLGKGEPFAASFYYDGEGFVFSLRSDETGLDVSEIAKQYGGGGHKHAAGFKLKSPLVIIDPKKIGLEDNG
jgi:oligoribonuclease NrnB/cAMP/cGMP phosphodiesterase (DHH superfamily)